MTTIRTLIVAGIMAIPTYLLFGLMGGFHHIYVFGCLAYMAWNGEDPETVHLTSGEERFQVVVHPIRFALTLAIWLYILWVTVMALRPSPANAMPPGTSPQDGTGVPSEGNVSS
jgi:hypothetical protein